MTTGQASQLSTTIARQQQAHPSASLFAVQVAYGPPASRIVNNTQSAAMFARSAGDTNVTASVSQFAVQTAFRSGAPGLSRSDAWTYVLDGHRFYVLPLGEEGDWAYDTTTKEWSQLQTQGLNGLNFQHGVMWQDVRVMGGDVLNPVILELDPNQPFDDGFREVKHVVTGGIPTRGRHNIGVANFTLIASVGDDQALTNPISLAFSDDNGKTYSQEFPIPLTDVGSQMLIWNALGSFAAPGRIFRITDYAGPVRIDGADCVLTVGSGADSGVDDG